MLISCYLEMSCRDRAPEIFAIGVKPQQGLAVTSEQNSAL